MPAASRSALVLYASETGNAQEVAEELGRLVTRLHFAVRVCAFDNVDLDALTAYSTFLCCVATTGQGEFPANARAFWKRLLRKKLPLSFLSATVFSLFGLGDSSYPKYNWAALKLHKRLIQLGSQELLTMGAGDEQHADGHYSSFLSWANELETRLLQTFPLENGVNRIPNNVLIEPQWLLSLAEEDHGEQSQLKDAKRSTYTSYTAATTSKGEGVSSSSSRVLHVRLEGNKRLTPTNHWQDVRQLTFSTPVSEDYLPGDVLTIYPRNSPEDVNLLVHLMGWDDIADKPMKFSHNPNCKFSLEAWPSNLANPLPTDDMTLRLILTQHADINAIPRRYFFEILAHFATDDFQKSRLLEFSNPEYLDELYDYTTRPRRSILEVLQEFDSVKIPWQWATTVLPRLRGRQFSIASGGKLKHDENGSTRFELLVAIVKYRTVIRKLRRGVCTKYLESLEVGNSLVVSLQKGGLNITQADAKIPAILVGPGTGVAPIRSLIWERWTWNREVLKQENATSERSKVGECVLFFGCRNKEADFFFESEWKSLKTDLPLQVFPAFSRDQNEKQYVQDLIRRHSRVVCDLIYEKEGLVFVCGSSGKMPQAVREALIAALEAEASLDRQAAEKHIVSMEKNNRYKQETW